MKLCFPIPTVLSLITLLILNSTASAIVLQNTPTGGSISAFGVPDSQTYGQVFTAPITGTLDSFTLYLNGGVGALKGGVGLWNGTAAHGFGFGESLNLYTSPNVASLSAGAYTFTPGINVVAGQRYVAYLSTFGVPGANSATSMPLGTNAPGIEYFVWNNTSNPANNPSWNYFFNAGDALFQASFSPVVPEPTSLAIVGCLSGVGVVVQLVRRRSKVVG